MQKTLKEITEFLFNNNFMDDSFDPEGEEIHLYVSQKLFESHPCNDIIQEWHNDLYNNCHTATEVINFANLFYYYEGADNYNPEPYKFIGYLYAHVNMDKYWDEAGDLFDSIAIAILENQLLINTSNDPYYNPLTDPNILTAINNWKNHLDYNQ